MLNLSYDFHIHSCLSPCGDNDMTPGNIVGMASLKGLDAIALTDHNSCKNCPAVKKLADSCGLLFIPGMELTTSEEVHILCYFHTLEEAMAFDEYIYKHLLAVPNREDIFGRQLICDENDLITGKVGNLLINVTDISIDDLPGILPDFNGIMVPAHLDKSSTSIISNLGFIPPDSTFKCAEFKNLNNVEKIKIDNPYLEKCNIITSSDAHYLEDINEAINFIDVTDKSVKAVLEALTYEKQST